MNNRVWFYQRRSLCFEDFDSHLEALSFANGLILFKIGEPVDIRDPQSGELIDDLLSLAA